MSIANISYPPAPPLYPVSRSHPPAPQDVARLLMGDPNTARGAIVIHVVSSDGDAASARQNDAALLGRFATYRLAHADACEAAPAEHGQGCRAIVSAAAWYYCAPQNERVGSASAEVPVDEGPHEEVAIYPTRHAADGRAAGAVGCNRAGHHSRFRTMARLRRKGGAGA